MTLQEALVGMIGAQHSVGPEAEVVAAPSDQDMYHRVKRISVYDGKVCLELVPGSAETKTL